MPIFLFLTLLDDPKDETLFTEVYERHRNKLYRIALAKLKDDHDAQDVVQDTFIALAKNFAKIRDFYHFDYPKFRGYIVTILENKIIDVFRRRDRRAADDYDALQIGTLQDSDLHCDLADALSRLSGKARIAFLLHYDMGFSPKEIAQQMNLNVWSVYKYINQAKTVLREYLETENGQY